MDGGHRRRGVTVPLGKGGGLAKDKVKKALVSASGQGGPSEAGQGETPV